MEYCFRVRIQSALGSVGRLSAAVKTSLSNLRGLARYYRLVNFHLTYLEADDGYPETKTIN